MTELAHLKKQVSRLSGENLMLRRELQLLKLDLIMREKDAECPNCININGRIDRCHRHGGKPRKQDTYKRFTR
jgi:hypothetical protein